MIKSHTKGLSGIVLVNLFAFLAHMALEPVVFTEIVQGVVNLTSSYLVNTLGVLSVCVALIYLNKMFESIIGFVYLALSVLKMMVLYIFLNPTNAAGKVFPIDAAAFLLPFGFNLLLELLFTVKLLKINDLVDSLRKE